MKDLIILAVILTFIAIAATIVLLIPFIIVTIGLFGK